MNNDEPERLSLEWHALRCEASARTYSTLPYAEPEVEEFRDRAAKLRELAVLREYALDGDGIQCKHCDAVCIDGEDGSMDWGTDWDEDERIRLCKVCSAKAEMKEKTDE